MRKKTCKSNVKKALAVALVACMVVPQSMAYVAKGAESESLTELTDEQIQDLYQNAEFFDRQSVHDPSIVVSGSDYYVFGSHMGVAKTTDLMNWSSTAISGEVESNAHFGKINGSGNVEKVSYNDAFLSAALTNQTVTVANGNEVVVDFSSFAGSEWISAINSAFTVKGNMWAADVVYNQDMNKWCMYLSLNGSNWNSVVVLLTADGIEGPYVYQAPIVYSGFAGSGNNSYLNTDLSLAINDGIELDTIPGRYDGLVSNGSWGVYWPHAIDPFVFYDEDDNLWLGYGSWSGGIYMLELDETTGLRDYNVSYPYEVNGVVQNDLDTPNEAVTSDPYFGTKIAGGCYVSGEGAYIEYIGAYYYLFISYGFYSPTGGYNMRVFRSENPDGPYVDGTGDNAIYTSGIDNILTDSNGRGIQLMGNYRWNTMDVAEVAQGHNSALMDADGNAYVIYHTKYDDGTAGHNLRVHQLFTNADGWLVAAPYEYSGETVNDSDISSSSIATEDIAGDYELLVHQYSNPKHKDDGTVEDNLDVITPVDITLNADGSISGAYTGTWSETAGTAYATITIGGTTYKGVFVRQTVDGSTREAVCFTAVSEAGKCIWGTKAMSDQEIIAYNVANPVCDIPSATRSNISLSTEAEYGATVSWSSSDTSVITNAGAVTPAAADKEVTLTKTITCGDYYYEQEYEVTVYGTDSDAPLGSYDSVSNGMNIMSSTVSDTTGVSLKFTVSGIESDWTPVFKTGDNVNICLAPLTYGVTSIYESAATLSSDATALGYTSGSAWTIYTDGATHEVMISYNVDGSIAFYRDGKLMLTYAATTAIGSSTVETLNRAIINAVKTGQLYAQYSMTDLVVDTAVDYVDSNGSGSGSGGSGSGGSGSEGSGSGGSVSEGSGDSETLIPSISGESGKTGWDAIVTEVGKVVADDKEDTVSVDMNGATDIPKSVIEAIKGKDVKLVLVMDDGIVWTIDGSKVTAADLDSIDMSVKLDTDNIPDDVLATVAKDKKATNVTLEHNGDFGFTAELTLNVGKDKAGMNAKLYYYNEKTGKMEEQETVKVSDAGDVKYTFTHASEYVIVYEASSDGEAGKPDTSDSANAGAFAWIMTGCFAMAAAATIFADKRKKRSIKEN